MTSKKFHPDFVLVSLSLDQVQSAVHHAMDRTKEIVRQFIPKKSALNHLETNYIGMLGELAVRNWAGIDEELIQDYTDHKPDEGDLDLNGKVYDIKTEAIPEKWFLKLQTGGIRKFDPYGCRVFTEKHYHHIKKYSGGIIFCSLPVKDGETAKDERIRESLLLTRDIMITGFISPEEIGSKNPTWYTPKNPKGGRRKYNSKNYIFHHTDLTPVRQILK